ncbi:uridine kinase family protein [Nocardia bovistercoris]|uniref:Uridine kinase n=1 Tax=Nocardia bovistercoris TaxID=2785916 RepID=A0A931N6S2_9NOCA|nr:hypothetical protein [Nocardia bovistercoris]MBH0779993.1 hypothetical protein [Nocardia bovistercoris]
MTSPSSIAAFASAVRASRPRCGPVRLVAIDGHAGSGKTGFAECLAAELGSAPILHLDDIATDDGFFDWFDRLHTGVLVPFAAGVAATHDVYDWTAHGCIGRRAIPAAPVVLIEGVGAGRRAVRLYTVARVWMDTDPEESWRRGRLRDGPAQAEFWDRWIPSELRHFAADPSREHADTLVRGTDYGYEVRPAFPRL